MLDTKSDQNESIIKINDSELMKVEIVLRQAVSEWASLLTPRNQNVWISYNKNIITND